MIAQFHSILFLFCLFALPLGCGSTSAKSPNNSSSSPPRSAARTAGKVSIDQVVKELHVGAAEIVRGGGSIIWAPPWYDFDTEEKKLSYFLGEVNRVALDMKDDDPHDLALVLLILAQGLEECFTNGADIGKFWQQPVRLLREEARKAVALADSSASSSGREQQLQLIEERASQLFGELKQGFMVAAIKVNMTARVVGNRSPASLKYTIQLSTVPPGGTIYVLTYLSYLKLRALKKPKDKWPWRTLNGEYEELLGRYKYRVTWPNGMRSDGVFEVDSPSSRTFRPSRSEVSNARSRQSDD